MVMIRATFLHLDGVRVSEVLKPLCAYVSKCMLYREVMMQMPFSGCSKHYFSNTMWEGVCGWPMYNGHFLVIIGLPRPHWTDSTNRDHACFRDYFWLTGQRIYWHSRPRSVMSWLFGSSVWSKNHQNGGQFSFPVRLANRLFQSNWIFSISILIPKPLFILFRFFFSKESKI